MGEPQLSAGAGQGVRAPGETDPHGRDVLPLRRRGLWLPGYLAMIALAGVGGGCLAAGWVYGASDPPPPLAEPSRIAGWIGLAGAVAAGALAWARRRPRRIVLQADGLWMPPFDEGASGSIWIPYEDVRAVHPLKAWRLRDRRCLVLGLRGRFPRFWRARAFVEADALDRLAASVRAGVARLPDGAERLREVEQRAASAVAMQRGWPVVTLTLGLVLAAVFLMEICLLMQHPDHAWALLVLLANGPQALAEGEPFRLVTGSLLHIDGTHISVNLLLLLLVGGGPMERLVGGRRFLVVVLAGGLGGMVASSALAGQLAVGASGAIHAAFASWIYLCFAYRDEVPGNLYMPLWLVFPLLPIVVGVDVVASERVWPGRIDHVDHAGGFAAGLVLSAIAIRDRPLATLARTPSRLATGLAAGLLALYAGGVAWGGMAAIAELRSDERETLERAVGRLERAHHPAVTRGYAAWQVATSSVATYEALRAARATAEEVAAKIPGDPFERDTLAMLYFRLGDAETAAEIERRVLREKTTAYIASQLARFERERLRGTSPGGSEEGVALRIVAGSEPWIHVDPPAGSEGVLDVYALVEDPGGELLGLAWLTLRCGSGGAEDCAVPAPDLPAGSALAVAHIARAPEGAEAPAWRFWPMDRDVATLPGPR